MSGEAMKMALELAQEGVEIHSPNSPEYKVCAALIEALNHSENNLDMVKQEQVEPVAWGDVKVRPDGKRYCRAVATTNQSNLGYSPLYTTPQQRKPLTVQEIAEFVGTHEYGTEQLKWFRLGEAAHGIKENT